MKVLAVGGGSGGHVTPIVAVLRELTKAEPATTVRFWCDKKFAASAQTIVNHFDPRLRVETIIAGKFRRYYHLTKLQHITIPTIFWPNIRDTMLVLAGTVQSFFKLLAYRPDVIFAKGGYVCLPVGWAARMLRIPLVIHDSDAHPGLTSRLLSGYATAIGTGVPLEYYSYPAHKSHYVGVPVNSEFRPYTPAEQTKAKQQLGFSAERPLLVIIGGGLGSKRINDAVATHLSALLDKANVYLIAGTEQYDELKALTPQHDTRFQLVAFIATGMPELLGAADIVVSRAGATSLLELAAAAKPVIIVPSKRLLWQVKHAQVFADQNAVIYLDEDRFEEPNDTSLLTSVSNLIADEVGRRTMAAALHTFAKPHAARDMAALIRRAAKRA